MKAYIREIGQSGLLDEESTDPQLPLARTNDRIEELGVASRADFTESDIDAGNNSSQSSIRIPTFQEDVDSSEEIEPQAADRSNVTKWETHKGYERQYMEAAGRKQTLPEEDEFRSRPIRRVENFADPGLRNTLRYVPSRTASPSSERSSLDLQAGEVSTASFPQNESSQQMQNRRTFAETPRRLGNERRDKPREAKLRHLFHIADNERRVARESARGVQNQDKTISPQYPRSSNAGRETNSSNHVSDQLGKQRLGSRDRRRLAGGALAGVSVAQMVSNSKKNQGRQPGSSMSREPFLDNQFTPQKSQKLSRVVAGQEEVLEDRSFGQESLALGAAALAVVGNAYYKRTRSRHVDDRGDRTSSSSGIASNDGNDTEESYDETPPNGRPVTLNGPNDEAASQDGNPEKLPSASFDNMDDKNAALRLEPMPMDADLAQDIRLELEDEDNRHPASLGQASLVDEFDRAIRGERSAGEPRGHEDYWGNVDDWRERRRQRRIERSRYNRRPTATVDFN